MNSEFSNRSVALKSGLGDARKINLRDSPVGGSDENKGKQNGNSGEWSAI